MKKSVLYALCIATAIIMTACGNTQTTPSPSASKASMVAPTSSVAEVKDDYVAIGGLTPYEVLTATEEANIKKAEEEARLQAEAKKKADQQAQAKKQAQAQVNQQAQPAQQVAEVPAQQSQQNAQTNSNIPADEYQLIVAKYKSDGTPIYQANIALYQKLYNEAKAVNSPLAEMYAQKIAERKARYGVTD